MPPADNRQPEAAATSETRVAQEVSAFGWDGHKLEPGIGIALSGGGFRAMLFHAGVLMRLNELGLLSKANRIASVSGGSIAAGYLASIWQKLGRPDAAGAFAEFKTFYVEPILAFSRQKVDVGDVLTGLLPGRSAAGEVARTYDRHLYRGCTLQDLPDQPRFVFCATNLQTGVLWRFSKPYAGDYLVGRLDKPKILLAEAVAASSAFPPVLSPKKFAFDPKSFKDWKSDARPVIQATDLASFRERVLLTDGGVYDNHGLEPIIKRYMTAFVSDGGAPFGRSASLGFDWVRQLNRILEVTDNQVRALRRRDLIEQLDAGNKAFASGSLGADETRPHERLGAYWGIDTDMRAALPDALACDASVADQLARVSTRLSDLGEQVSKQLVNWGYAICDYSLRLHYKGPVIVAATKPAWPFPEESLSS